jgi:HK97 family phage prohead protease
VDVVENGLTSYRKNPIILLQHESDKPIGQAVSRDIESKGRNITAKITKNTDGIMDDIRSGTVKAFSIGFIPQGREYIDTRTNTLIKDMTEQDRDEIPYNKIGRVFTEIEIKEVSVVSVPANADSLFTMKRSFRQFFDEYETRSAVRYLVKDHENPFLDKVESVDDIDTEDEEVETAETVEDTPEMA